MAGPSLEESLRSVARPLRRAADLDPLIERLAGAKVALLGEASHGTHEFYTWRAEISRRLVEEHGFDFVAVEGDWPDCYRVNRFVKAYPGAGESARDVLHAFERWPTWMWANEEVVELAEWLRARNRGSAEEEKAGFYGLDVYSLWESMEAVLEYLRRVDPRAADRARRAYGCFDPYEQDVQEYAMATAMVPTSCEDEAVAILSELRRKAPAYKEDGREAYFDAEQNALSVRGAERYYRAMVRGGPTSWNVRDTHMIETLERLLDHHGPESRGIVWEHNTHIGDARATDMRRAGMVNVGQLARERWGEDRVALVGFSSHHGSVVAGEAWGAPMQVMEVPAAREGSWEHALHAAGEDDRLLFTEDLGPFPAARKRLGHRAIGVVYDAAAERWGNYVPTDLARRYDALLHIDESRALEPLHMAARRDGEPPETYPTGM